MLIFVPMVQYLHDWPGKYSGRKFHATNVVFSTKGDQQHNTRIDTEFRVKCASVLWISYCFFKQACALTFSSKVYLCGLFRVTETGVLHSSETYRALVICVVEQLLWLEEFLNFL